MLFLGNSKFCRSLSVKCASVSKSCGTRRWLLVRNMAYSEVVDLSVFWSPPPPLLSVISTLRDEFNASLVFFKVALTTRGMERLALDFNDSSRYLLVVLTNPSSLWLSPFPVKRLFKFKLGTVTLYVSPSNKLPWILDLLSTFLTSFFGKTSKFPLLLFLPSYEMNCSAFSWSSGLETALNSDSWEVFWADEGPVTAVSAEWVRAPGKTGFPLTIAVLGS